MPEAKVIPERTNKKMLDPRSWSLDSWLTIFQGVSALALAVTVVIGFFLTRKQARTILSLERALETERIKRLELQKFLAPRELPSIEMGDDPFTSIHCVRSRAICKRKSNTWTRTKKCGALLAAYLSPCGTRDGRTRNSFQTRN